VCLCWVLYMLGVVYAECHYVRMLSVILQVYICWVLYMPGVVNAERCICWALYILCVVYSVCCIFCVLYILSFFYVVTIIPIMLSVVILDVTMLRVVMLSIIISECQNEACFAECNNHCHIIKRRFMLCVIMLSAVMLSVIACLKLIYYNCPIYQKSLRCVCAESCICWVSLCMYAECHYASIYMPSVVYARCCICWEL